MSIILLSVASILNFIVLILVTWQVERLNKHHRYEFRYDPNLRYRQMVTEYEKDIVELKKK